jgi:hypothetical protein
MVLERIKIGKTPYPKGIKFPILAKWTPNGEIVLFGKSGHGMVIECTHDPKRIGNASEHYVGLNDHRWEILPIGSKVVIKNTV